MRNGYALASRSGLIDISNRLQASGESELDELRKLLRIGIQWKTQVTLKASTHRVSQAYCSALPVGYSDQTSDLWEDFALLVLEAAYEATICTAILNYRSTGNNRVFLTLLGGGVFRNKTSWITESIKRALKLYQDWNIEVAVISYSGSNKYVQEVAEQFPMKKDGIKRGCRCQP